MAKKQNDYFVAFEKLVDFSCQAAECLQESMQQFDPATLRERMDSLHAIEHAADIAKHEITQRLAKEFVTPIDRADIVEMTNVLDEVTDLIEDVLIRMYMYNITRILPEALEFTDVIVRCCRALQSAMGEFHNFHKPANLLECVVAVNTMEEEGDALYIQAVRKLYTSGKDPVEIAAWSKTFDRLEDCCDACEHVANLMESIVMKNA